MSTASFTSMFDTDAKYQQIMISMSSLMESNNNNNNSNNNNKTSSSRPQDLRPSPLHAVCVGAVSSSFASAATSKRLAPSPPMTPPNVSIPPPRPHSSRMNINKTAIAQQPPHPTPTPSTAERAASALSMRDEHMPGLAESIEARDRQREQRKSLRQQHASYFRELSALTDAERTGRTELWKNEEEAVQWIQQEHETKVFQNKTSSPTQHLTTNRNHQQNVALTVLQRHLQNIQAAASNSTQRALWRVVREVVWEEDFMRRDGVYTAEMDAWECIVATEEIERFALITDPCILFVLPAQRNAREEIEVESREEFADLMLLMVEDAERIFRRVINDVEDERFTLSCERWASEGTELVARVQLANAWEEGAYDIASECLHQITTTLTCETWRCSNEEDNIRCYIDSCERRERDELTLSNPNSIAQTVHQSWERFIASLLLLEDQEAVERMGLSREVRRQWQLMLEEECHGRVDIQRAARERRRSAVERAILDAQRYEEEIQRKEEQERREMLGTHAESFSSPTTGKEPPTSVKRTTSLRAAGTGASSGLRAPPPPPPSSGVVPRTRRAPSSRRTLSAHHR
eukprot:PhM_4_TR5363/c0_g1_i1/m.80315